MYTIADNYVEMHELASRLNVITAVTIGIKSVKEEQIGFEYYMKLFLFLSRFSLNRIINMFAVCESCVFKFVENVSFATKNNNFCSEYHLRLILKVKTN